MYWISSIVAVIYVVKCPPGNVCCCSPCSGVMNFKLVSGVSSYKSRKNSNLISLLMRRWEKVTCLVIMEALKLNYSNQVIGLLF